MRKLEVRILDPRIGRDMELPRRATSGSAGLDLRACIDAPLVLEPGKTELVPTGIAIHLGDPGLAAMLLPRSGLDGADGVVGLDVLGPRVDRRIVLVWRADYVPPAARAFIDHLPISAA